MNISKKRLPLLIPIIILFFSLNINSVILAHEVLKKYIHHNIVMYVGRNNIDIELSLEFYEKNSLMERQRMDVNQDGKITKNEIDKYLASLSKQFENGLNLTIDNRKVELFTLYDPKIEFLKNNLVTPTTHIIRLTYFARTPKSFAAKSKLVLEDYLWSSIPLISRFNVIGKDSIHVVAAESDSDLGLSSESKKKGRLFIATCTAFPNTQ
ncbi:MAG: hypothetical protein GXO90_02220 [FCB group bacterium]|nr:hypothetical protein [FCB group bacterium]